MRRIHYAGDEFVTGDEIAAAVVTYAEALAVTGRAASVEIPVRGEDGRVLRALLLIGPASQIVAEELAAGSEDLLDEEILDEELVDRLRRQRDALVAPAAETSPGVPPSAPEQAFVDFDGFDDESGRTPPPG